MWLPRFRFTIRRMMVAVAIIGILVGSLEMWRRHRSYLAWERTHARTAEAFRLYAMSQVSGRPGVRLYLGSGDRPPGLATKPQVAAWIEHHDHLRRKYGRAARYPWLPVAPDPPEPE